jgi:3-mercaptopyruvate sulfurtransferase SseA
MNRRTLLTAALLLVAGVASAAEQPEPFGRLTVDEVAAKVGKPGVYLFDNNRRETYAEGHVPGAVWVDDENVTAQVLPKDKDATLIFYCANEH